MLKNQLILIVGLQYNRILVEAANFSHEPDATDQEDRYRHFVAPHGVEINILNILLGGSSFVFHFRLHKIHQGKGLLAGGLVL